MERLHAESLLPAAQRLRGAASKDPVKYEDYFQIVKDDVVGLNGVASNTSVTKGMLWLKR